jgi:23S rRNA pseudouridine2605 synthase
MNHSQDDDLPASADDVSPVASAENTDAGADAPKRRRRGPRVSNEAAAAGEASTGAAVEPGLVADPNSLPHAADAREADAEALDGERSGGATTAEAPLEGPSRRSRRNRRRGRKGKGPREDGGGVGEPGTDGAGGPTLPMPPMPDAGDLFATVTSGTFDDEASANETAAADESRPGSAEFVGTAPEAGSSEDVRAEPAVENRDGGETEGVADPSRRVLAPEADAPKLQKVLAQAGVGSRRDLEQMIVDKRVTVNGEPAHTGQRVSWGDRVAVDGKPVRVRIAPLPTRVIAYHKPAGGSRSVAWTSTPRVCCCSRHPANWPTS